MISGARRGLMLAAFAVLAAALVAACGSSGSSGSSSSASKTTASAGSGSSTTAGGAGAASGQFAKLQSCLKSQGVTLPTRGHFPAGGFGHGTGTGTGTGPAAPTGTGTNAGGAPPTGGAPGGGYPGGGAGRGFAANPKLRAAIQTCDKKLGIKGGFGAGGFGGRGGRTTFSAATLAKFESCMKDHGVTLTKSSSGGGIFSKSAESNPKFKTAFAACRTDLNFGAPGGGTGTSTTSSS